MRLLHLYSGNLYGGIERVLLTLAETGASGIEQQFCLFFEGRLANELRAIDAELSVLGRAQLSQPWTILHARRALSREFADRRPDLVLAHSPWVLAVAGRAIVSSGARCALWLHNPPGPRRWPDGWALRRYAETVIANSRYTAEASESRVAVAGWVYPPVPPPPESSAARRAETRSQLGASDADVVILQASRIEPWKGLREHLIALANLNGLPQWVLWIAGAPQRRSERAFFDQLRVEAASHGIADRVRFLGHRTDMSDLMAAADIYCQPNTEPEPFGVAFVEAMWARRPVVTTTAGGLAAEIVDGSSGPAGVVVPTHDEPALVAALRELVLSRELRERLGAAGFVTAARLCDPVRQVEQLVALLAPSGFASLSR